MSSISSPRFAIVPILEDFGAEIKPYSTKLRCPFHPDSHASGWYSEEYQYFKCLACGVRGDAIGLLMRQGGLEPVAAYERAKELAGEPDRPVRGTTVASSLLPGRPGIKRGSSRFGSPGGGV